MLANPPTGQLLGDISVVGNTLGAKRKGVWSKQTRVDGEMTLRAFSTWCLSAERRLKTYEPIRIEGGRVRRAMQKAGTVFDTVRPDDKRTLEQLLGFLSLCARKYPEKGIDRHNKLAVLRGWGVSRVLPEKPVVEIELFGTRLILDGQLRIAGAQASAVCDDREPASPHERFDTILPDGKVVP